MPLFTTDQFVIPGNIIYKQRGTIWHAGENAIRGRDHTIHAAVEGYVKYYRDPERHPDKQYIGVAFNKEDTLPYPRNEPRRRKLNMVPVQRKVTPRPDDINASGLPRRVVIPGNVFDVADLESRLWKSDKKRELNESNKAAAAAVGGSSEDATKDLALTPEEKPRTRTDQRRFVHKLEFIQKRWLERRRTRTLHFNAANYSYAESNSAIGRLAGRTMYIPPWKLGGRRSRFRARRQRREKELARQRKAAEEERLRKREKKLKAEQKRAARLAKQIAAGAGKKKAKEAVLLEGAKGGPEQKKSAKPE